MSKYVKPVEIKSNLHIRNRHRLRYDFPELIRCIPELADFVSPNQFNDLSIDFKNADAVKLLNKALLKHFYKTDHWDIPEGYLCPPIPGRADYIHYMADLLALDHNNMIPKGKSIKVLDIGTGANCIYPIIAHKEYGWSLVGTDIDYLAIRSAKNIADANLLSKAIEIRKQASAEKVFDGIIKPGEKFNLSICNPPFHSSAEAAKEGSERKWKNLNSANSGLNFGGQHAELYCDGGEERFLDTMIRESVQYQSNCKWFSSLVSDKKLLPLLYKTLAEVKAVAVKTINMSQGQKVSRVIVWTFPGK
ncbi:MAG: 23S rRNA (adenine(1618)-N(6))-methyltransferase RlmF [Flavobacterium sp.]|nr:23S rRNA (adenine(1618)-N(6))-methyltransferase RlmF [Pedobacter sp.]